MVEAEVTRLAVDGITADYGLLPRQRTVTVPGEIVTALEDLLGKWPALPLTLLRAMPALQIQDSEPYLLRPAAASRQALGSGPLAGAAGLFMVLPPLSRNLRTISPQLTTNLNL